MSLATEFEAKFYPVVKSEIRNKLKSLGAELEYPERVMRRTLFSKPANDGMKVDYVRVRDEGDVIRLSAKVHAKSDDELADQKEVDTSVGSFDDAIEILKLAGLKVSSSQITKRETWKYKDSHVEIDTWPGLETYIEIESKSEERVQEIAEDLDLSWDDRIITSVVEIYMEIYDKTREEVLAAMENLDFDNLPFQK